MRLGRKFEQIIAAAERAGSLTRQLLAFSRKQVLRPRVFDVNSVLSSMGPMIERLVGEDIKVDILLEDGPARIKSDPSHLEQILLNLTVNARDAMEQGGCLTIEAQVTNLGEAFVASHMDMKRGQHVVLTVSDSGAGMDQTTCARVFEPFFTTKGPGRGTGLGLATVFGIVKQNGGTILVYSEVGHGTTFKIYLPCSDEPETVAATPSPTRRLAQGGVILVAEDDPQLRKVLVTVITRAGFTCIEAAGPVEAVALARSHDGPIDLLLTDVVMPQMSGKRLAEMLTERRPGLPVLFMSGYTDDSIVHHGVLDEGVHFLPKPVTPDQVLEAIDQVLGHVEQERAG